MAGPQTTGYFYPANGAINTKTGKRRPGTANRKTQNHFGKKTGYGALQTSIGGVPLSAKAASQIE